MKYIPTQDLQKSLPAIIIFLKNRNIYCEGYQIKPGTISSEVSYVQDWSTFLWMAQRVQEVYKQL